MDIRLKRAYSEAASDDGTRVLIDRLWPRGIAKENAHIDLWLKEIAPSTELRKWFGHEPSRWEKFRERYFHELDEHPDEVSRLRELAHSGPLTLVYGAKDEEHNDAVAIKEYLESRPKRH